MMIDSTKLTGGAPAPVPIVGKLLSPTQIAGRIALSFLSLAVIWILGSDYVAHRFAKDAPGNEYVQTVKGIAFVSLTSAFIYFLVRGYVQQLFEHAKRSRDSASQLHDLHERLRLGLDAAEIGSWSFDIATGMLKCDPRAAKHFGGGRIESLGELLARLHPDDQAKALEASALMKSGVSPPNVEFRFPSRDGSVRWIQLCTKVLPPTQAGSAGVAIGTTQDITERKQTELELSRREAKLRRFVTETPVPVAMLDRNGVVLAASDTWIKSIAADESDAVSKPIETVAPLLTERLQEAVLRASERLTPMSGMETCEDVSGTLRWFRWQVRSWFDDALIEDGYVVSAEDVTSQIASQRALVSSEARFRSMYQNALAGMALFSELGIVKDCNPAFSGLFGCSPAELQGEHISSLIDPADKPQFMNELADVTGGRIRSLERQVRFVTRQNEKVFARLSLVWVPEIERRTASLLAVCVDITEIERTTRALAEREQRLKYVMDATGDGLWDWDLEKKRITHNARWCQMLGLDVRFIDHDDQYCVGLVHPGDRELYKAATRQSIETGVPLDIEFRAIKSDGSIIWVNYRGAVVERDAKGNARRLVGSVTDISERKSMEAARERLLSDLEVSSAEINHQKRLFETVFESNPDGMMIVDRNRVLRKVNKATEQIFGCSRADLEGVNAAIIFGDDQSARETLDLDGDMTEPMLCPVTSFRRKDGEVFPAQIVLARIRDDGRDFGSLLVLRDLTAEKQREQALAESQQLEALGRLTGGIAHDFTNVLTVVSGNLKLLQPRLSDTFCLNRLDEAERAAGMGMRLVQRLLTFARKRELAPQIIQLNQLVTSLQDMLAQAIGDNIAITVRLKANPDRVHVDLSEMENAVLNLILNARDAMPGGGQIELETINKLVASEDATAELGIDPGEYVCLTVKDSGSGMSAEVLSRALEPFFSTKDSQGSGLGLTTVQGFVRQSGGHIDIQSVVGEGTTVQICLPVHRATAQ